MSSVALSRISVPLTGSAGAGQTVNFTSRLLVPPFTVTRILVVFPASTALALQYRFWYHTDSNQPATGTPNGIDILSDVVQSGIVVGESIAYWIAVNKSFVGSPRSLCLSATNNTANALIAAAILEVAINEPPIE